MSENVLFLSDKFVNGYFIFTPDDLRNKASQFMNRDVVLMPYIPGKIDSVPIDCLKKALKSDSIYYFLETTTRNDHIEELFKDELAQARTNIKSLIDYINDHIKNYSEEDLDVLLTIDAHEWYPYQVKLALLRIIEESALSSHKNSYHDNLRISAMSELVKFSNLKLSIISGEEALIKENVVKIIDENLMRNMWEIRKMSFIAKMHREIYGY